LAAQPSWQNLQALNNAVSVIDGLPFSVNLWKVQNRFYEMLQHIYPKMRATKESGDPTGDAWLTSFAELGHRLRIKLRD
jgi:hypothetical protein